MQYDAGSFWTSGSGIVREGRPRRRGDEFRPRRNTLYSTTDPRPRSAGGRGSLPRIMSAAFSAIITVGPFRLALTTLGITEASTYPQGGKATHPERRVHDRHLVLSHAAGAGGVVLRFRVLPHEAIQFIVAVPRLAGRKLRGGQATELSSSHDPPQSANAVTETPGARLRWRADGRKSRAARKDRRNAGAPPRGSRGEAARCGPNNLPPERSRPVPLQS